MHSLRHVAVTSDHSLVADTVSAALAGPQLHVVRLAWTGDASLHVPVPRTAEPFTAGVLLSELQPLTRLAEAQRLVQQVPTSWIVLTAAPRGPLWGALLEVGAVAVLRSSTSLDEVRTAVDRLADGATLMDRSEVQRLRTSWQEVEAERRRAAENLRSLSPREAEVLALVHAGESVSRIAVQFGVSEATVRSQVRAVLHKLGVRSQLAAAAAYQAMSERMDEAT
jgi:DNA-binding NarL/FixJ family response regulator